MSTTPTADPIEVLLAHDTWATRELLTVVATLPTEQFTRQFPMGPGSIQATLTHMLGAVRAWTDLLAGRDFRPRLEATGPYRPEQLLTFLDESVKDFATHARAHPLSGLVHRVRDGKTYTFTRCVVITHVATHGMHHRAQCLNMLRQLGVTPLPKSSVVEWMVAEAPVS